MRRATPTSCMWPCTPTPSWRRSRWATAASSPTSPATRSSCPTPPAARRRSSGSPPRGTGTWSTRRSAAASDNVLAGTLTVMMGGAPDDVARARETVAAYADPIFLIAGLGSALVVKLLNNALFAANIQLVDPGGAPGQRPRRRHQDVRRRHPAVERRELRDGPGRSDGLVDNHWSTWPVTTCARTSTSYARSPTGSASTSVSSVTPSTAVPPISEPDERAHGGCGGGDRRWFRSRRGHGRRLRGRGHEHRRTRHQPRSGRIGRVPAGG